MIHFISNIIFCCQISDVFFHIHPVTLEKKLCPITIASFTSIAKVLLQLMQRLTSGYVSMFQLYFIHESVWEQNSGAFTNILTH